MIAAKESEASSCREQQPANGDVQRLALRPKEAAKALGLGARKLWELTNRGLIPHVRLDKAILYPVEAINKWLSEQSAGMMTKNTRRS